jgi:hypothetical protein
LSLALCLAFAPIAGATIEGPCEASIAGQDVKNRETNATSDPITVAEGSSVRVSMSAARPITHLKVELEFAGIRWTVHDEPTTGRTWSKEVAVDDYATYGVGLYKVIGSSSGPGLSCSGAALVKVEGNPLTTVAGLVGLGLAIVGGVAVGLLSLRGGGSGGALVLGALFGALFGLGLGVLLQEYALLYPTLVVTIVLLAGGAVLGLVLSGVPRLSGRA